jgi:hypothetical protein
VKLCLAILEVMWDWRGMTSGAGYDQFQSPRIYEINPVNFTGSRLYWFLDSTGYDLRVTNACPQLVTSADKRGTPDPKWLKANLGS